MAGEDICMGVVGLVFMFLFMIIPMLFTFVPFVVFFLIVATVIYGFFRMVRPTSGPGGIFLGGARADLDSVEAGVVLGMNPLRIIGMIVMSLVRKGQLRVKSTNPLRVEAVPADERDAELCRSCGAPLGKGAEKCDYCGVGVAETEELAYYESAFLENAISIDGTLDEGGANGVIRMLESQVESKMAGCSGDATREFYMKKLDGLWRELGSAPDDAKAYSFGRNAGWLALDTEFSEKTMRFADDKRVSRLVGALRETVEDSGIDEKNLG